jgi:hypothetical protein
MDTRTRNDMNAAMVLANVQAARRQASSPTPTKSTHADDRRRGGEEHEMAGTARVPLVGSQRRRR